jgi:hypothetical protein
MAKSYDEYRLGEPYERPRRKGLKVLAIVATLMAITIVPALAAKGGSGKHAGSGGGSTTGGGSITGPNEINDTDGALTKGDQVTFTFSTTATDYPYIQLVCSDGTQTLENWQGFFPTALGNQWFVLSMANADCTANLEMYSTSGRGSWVKLASTPSFHVSP